MNKALFNEQRPGLGAEVIDVHRATADKIFYPADQLLRTGGVVTIDGNLTGNPDNRLAAERAGFWRFNYFFRAIP